MNYPTDPKRLLKLLLETEMERDNLRAIIVELQEQLLAPPVTVG